MQPPWSPSPEMAARQAWTPCRGGRRGPEEGSARWPGPPGLCPSQGALALCMALCAVPVPSPESQPPALALEHSCAQSRGFPSPAGAGSRKTDRGAGGGGGAGPAWAPVPSRVPGRACPLQSQTPLGSGGALRVLGALGHPLGGRRQTVLAGHNPSDPALHGLDPVVAGTLSHSSGLGEGGCPSGRACCPASH